MIGLVFGVGVVILIAIIAMKNLGGEDKRPAENPSTSEPAPPGEMPPGRQPTKPPPVADASPAPELPGQMIITADGLFKAAKKLHAEALRAEQAGQTEQHEALLDRCRSKLDSIHRYFQDHTAWLAQAHEKEWEVPRAYDTLQRRLSRYDKWKDRRPELAEKK